MDYGQANNYYGQANNVLFNHVTPNQQPQYNYQLPVQYVYPQPAQRYQVNNVYHTAQGQLAPRQVQYVQPAQYQYPQPVQQVRPACQYQVRQAQQPVCQQVQYLPARQPIVQRQFLYQNNQPESRPMQRVNQYQAPQPAVHYARPQNFVQNPVTGDIYNLDTFEPEANDKKYTINSRGQSERRDALYMRRAFRDINLLPNMNNMPAQYCNYQHGSVIYYY